MKIIKQKEKTRIYIFMYVLWIYQQFVKNTIKFDLIWIILSRTWHTQLNEDKAVRANNDIFNASVVVQ